MFVTILNKLHISALKDMHGDLPPVEHKMVCSGLSTMHSLEVFSFYYKGTDDIIGVLVKCCPKIKVFCTFRGILISKIIILFPHS